MKKGDVISYLLSNKLKYEDHYQIDIDKDIIWIYEIDYIDLRVDMKHNFYIKDVKKFLRKFKLNSLLNDKMTI